MLSGWNGRKTCLTGNGGLFEEGVRVTGTKDEEFRRLGGAVC